MHEITNNRSSSSSNMKSTYPPGQEQLLLERMSPEQIKAIRLDKDAIRIAACAGSGKTETLTRRILRLLLIVGIDPAAIVAFTFTERAAQAMKSRLHTRIAQLEGPHATRKLGPMFVGTIHSFCLRILQDHAGYGNYDVQDEHREVAFANEHCWSLGLREAASEILGHPIAYPAAVSIFLRSMSTVYDNLIDRAALKRFSPKFAQLLEQYENLMTNHLLLNFGQLIFCAVQVLEQDEFVRNTIAGSIRHLLVDEYQDLNPSQERLIKLLVSKGANLFVVGDKNQCIYQWRGSDVRCFERFQGTFPSAEPIALRENRRSVPGIIRVANAFSRFLTRDPAEHMIPCKEECGESVWWVEQDTPSAEADWVADKILELNEAGFRFSDMAILVRSVSTSGAPFIQKFEERKIPFMVAGRTGLFRRREAQALGCIFAWLAEEPWVENLYTGARLAPTEHLLEIALEHYWGCTKEDFLRIRSDLEQLKKVIKRGRLRNITELYRQIMRILGFLELDAANPNNGALMAIMGRFNELLTDYESMVRRQDTSRMIDMVTDWRQFLKGFTWFVNSYASSAYEEEAAEDMREVDAVFLTTVHQAKGLEWPIVFIPSLVFRRFPSSKTGQTGEWLLHKAMFDIERYTTTMEDERRLFYVALTRAKNGLYLSWFRRYDRILADLSAFVATTLPEDYRPEASSANIPEVPKVTPEDEIEVSTYSPSEIICYRRCPYNYLLRQVWGFQPGLAHELGYGKAVHHIMRLIGQESQSGKEINTAVTKTIIEDHFYLPYAPTSMVAAMKESAIHKLTRFVEDNLGDIVRIQQVEVRLEFPVGAALVYGIVDVILRHEQETMEARDYKTTRANEYSDDEADFQIKLYSAGLQQMGYPIVLASVANLEEGTIRQVDVSEETITSVLDEAQGYIIGIKSKNYMAKPSQYCVQCDYRDICRYRKST
jgi:DNA helicase-2/ATP-dependent DNA helicase PcrA